MRSIIIFGLILIAVPVVVLNIQQHRANSGIGSPASYLEIEQPRLLPPDHPSLKEPGIPVLCYHYLSPPPGPIHVARVAAAVILNLPTLDEKHFWSLPVDMFESHLRWLRDNGYTTITAAELTEIMAGERKAPEKAVCITFDDGERSLLDYGLPLLQEYDMKATLFLVTGRVGQKWKSLQMMNWGELAQLEASGHVSIESHSHDMHYKVKTLNSGMEPVHRYWAPEGKSNAPSGRVLDDLRRSRAEIKRHLRKESVALAWPYGFGSHRLDELARMAGFTATFSLKPGSTRPEADSPWHIRRFTITARTTVGLLAEMVDGDATPSTGLDHARMD
jgi:peptidoglycan/xylan/chitin deacetylase (PgdA/CDA1 family)